MHLPSSDSLACGGCPDLNFSNTIVIYLDNWGIESSDLEKRQLMQGIGEVQSPPGTTIKSKTALQ